MKRTPKQLEWEAERLTRSALPYNKLYLGMDGEYWNDALNYLVVPVGSPQGDQTHCVLVAYVGQPDGGPWKVQIITHNDTIEVDDVFTAMCRVRAIVTDREVTLRGNDGQQTMGG